MSAPSTLLLSRTLIAQLATPGDYLAAVRSAFTQIAQGRIDMPAVGHVSGTGGAFHIKAARSVSEQSLAVIKVNGNFPENGRRHRLPTIQGFIALLDAERGCVLALLDSTEITARRTAAATALAAQYLANPNAHVLGIVGCGVQSRYHVEALRDVAPIESVVFCDLNDDAANSFSAYLQRLGVPGTRVRDPSAACRGADIVLTLTTSTRPLIEIADVASGTFVAGVGADNPQKHELAPSLMLASRVVVDSLAQASEMGDLHHVVEHREAAAACVYGELADLVSGRIAGRRDPSTRWVFDSTGLAAQDLAAAAMIYERARVNEHIPRMRLDDSFQ
jgi:ornithine cyclodeaminase/alanine dehydrogenase-like protein (mu-crystallin family)